MNTGKKFSKMLFLVLLLVAFVAGCGSDDDDAAPLSSAKAITAFVLNGATGVIDEAGKTISVTLPYGTSKVDLIATFSTTGASVMVGTTVQTSGVGPANDFTLPVIYTVNAANGTSVDYAVTVTVGLATSNSIFAYSIAGQVSSAISGTAITVTMPYSTPTVTAGIATFSHSGASIKIGLVAQVSGSTSNSFASPVTYTVTAANGDIKTYIVTVTNALNSAKAITAYTITSQVSSTIIASAITVTMPFSTPSVTNLVATFTASPDAVVTVGSTTQVSGTTPNNFTSPVVYTVHAENGTTATYTVTVNLAAAPAGPAICTGVTGTLGNNCIDLGTAANFAILAEAAITNVPTSAVTGNIGVYPTSAAIGITCAEVTGTIFSPDATGPLPCRVTDGTGLNIAVGDKLAAYNDGFGRLETSGAFLNIGTPAGTLDASVSPLAPGAYVWTSGISIPVDLTLNGSATDVWVLKVGGAVALNAQVLLTGGALPENVFWVVAGTVTVGAGNHIEGVVLATGDITMITGSSAKGRLLSATQVVLQSATVTEP